MKAALPHLCIATALLGACAVPVAPENDGRAIVSDRADGGFNVTVRMTEYQPFPNRAAMHERCGLAAIDAVHAEATRRRLEGVRIDPAEVRTSTNRNSLLGTTNCTATIAVAAPGAAQDRAQFLAHRQANAPVAASDGGSAALIAAGSALLAPTPQPVFQPAPAPVTCSGQRTGRTYATTCW